MRAENRWIEEGAFLTVVEGVEDLVALAIIKLFDFRAEDSVGDTGAELDLVEMGMAWSMRRRRWRIVRGPAL